MQRKLVALGLTALMIASPVFAAKAKTVKHSQRNISANTLAKRQSHLASEIAMKATKVSDKATSGSNKKLKTQASFLHKAASESHMAAQDLLQAAKYSRR